MYKDHTPIVKSLVASALPSGNAPFLPENCYNYKFFGIHIFLYVVCIGPTQKNWRKPPKSDIFPHPNSTLQKWARQKSCRLIHSHVKTIVKKMHGELLPPPNHPSNPLQPPLVEVWIAGKENGDRQTDKVFCRPTPWVWQKCMENSGGTTFRWPVKLLRESNPTPNVCVC